MKNFIRLHACAQDNFYKLTLQLEQYKEQYKFICLEDTGLPSLNL